MTYKLAARGRRGGPKKQPRLEERIGPRITLFGSLIAVFVGINTLVTTCSTRTTTHYQGFRQAVEVEENYWRNLYNDYFDILREPPEQRGARLALLRNLAQRPTPEFKEFRLGFLGWDTRAKEEARTRLEGLSSRMREALSQPATSSPQIVDRNFTEAVQRNDTVVTTVAATGRTVVYQPQTLALGNSRGLDLDVFWCGGGGDAAEEANYRTGFDAAHTLATKSDRRELLAPGLPFGRVRLIMLPESRQNTTHRADGGGGTYPSRGYGLAIHADGNERAWAQTLAGQLGGYRIVNSVTGTRWYMSLFSCAAGGPRQQAAATAPDTATTAPESATAMAR